MAENVVGSLSLGRQCAAYGCFEYLYKIENGARVATGNKFFSFPKSLTEINVWCNLIKRQNGKDGFKVTSATRICSKHFPSSEIYKPPGGTKCRLLANARPTLHTWNDFQGGKTRKAPTVRSSPRKKCRTSLQLETDEPLTMEHNNNTNLSIDFDINVTEPTPGPSENATLKELRQKNENLLAHTKILEMEQKSKITNFAEHVLSSDKNCNHYTGFPKIDILHAVLEFLDPGLHGENIVLYNSKSANKELETRGRKRHFSPIESFILTMVRLRRNFDSYLCNVSDGTVSNTINTWINFMYLKLGTIIVL